MIVSAQTPIPVEGWIASGDLYAGDRIVLVVKEILAPLFSAKISGLTRPQL